MFIGGDFSSNLYQSLDFILTPCNYIHNEMSVYGDTVSPECVADLDAQLSYMGPLDIVIFMNSERFDQQVYGEDSIVKESVILHKQVDQNSPSWVSKVVSTSLLSDQTDFLQLGSSYSRYFYSGFNDLNPQPSSWNKFPTEEDPFAQYKFCSVSFELDKNLRQINR